MVLRGYRVALGAGYRRAGEPRLSLPADFSSTARSVRFPLTRILLLRCEFCYAFRCCYRALLLVQLQSPAGLELDPATRAVWLELFGSC